MKTCKLNRRAFVKNTLGLAAVAGLAQPASRVFAQTSPETAPFKAIRLGGPAFAKEEDPEKLALAHLNLGYRAAYCPKLALTETDRIRAFEQAFAKHDVVPAEVGRWCNLMEADTEKRAKNLANVTEGLALAEALGARCCVDIAGSFSPTSWFGPHPDNLTEKFFDAAVENARKIIDAVQPKRTKFTYEAMGWAMPDSPDCYLRMIKAVDRPAFAVHLDPCNLVNSPDKFYRNTALLNECFDKLGPWIVSCHAKDLTWDVEMNVHFREVCIGAGKLDFATYLGRLATLPGDVPLMIEHMKDAAEFDRSRRHVLEVGGKIGVTFD